MFASAQQPFPTFGVAVDSVSKLGKRTLALIQQRRGAAAVSSAQHNDLSSVDDNTVNHIGVPSKDSLPAFFKSVDTETLTKRVLPSNGQTDMEHTVNQLLKSSSMLAPLLSKSKRI